MSYVQKALCTCTVIATFVLISGCAKTLSRDDAAKLIAASNNFQQLRSSILFRPQWDQTAHNEGVITSYSGFYCTIVDPRLLAMLTSANCNSFTAVLRQPVSAPRIDVTGVTDAALPSNSAKIKEVQFSWTYHDVPGPLNRFIVNGGTGRALIQLYDDGWRVENLNLSPGMNAPYVLSEAERAEAQQQMAMRQDELNREAEAARLQAERARAEQERAAAVIGNSQIRGAQPIATFNVLLSSYFTKGSNPGEGQYVVWNTGLQFPGNPGRADPTYLWFGNMYAILKAGKRETIPGFVTNESYPTIAIQVRDGKNGIAGASLVMFTYARPGFENDVARDKFYTTVVDALNNWRNKFPEAN